MALTPLLTQIDFPFEHALYGRLERFDDAPLLTAQALADYTRAHPVDASVTEFGECPRCYFQTSGTSGQAKQIPYSAADLQRQIEHEARSFGVAGLSPADVVLTLASPPPSLSAWATINGSEWLGASVLNTSYVDFDKPVAEGTSEAATFVFGTPLMLEMIGNVCVETWGSVAAAFPNVKAGILYGDLLPSALRSRIESLWDIDIRFLYGSVEADVIAMGCAGGGAALHVMDEKVAVELLPEATVRPGITENLTIVPLANADDRMRGEVVVSDLHRDHLPLIRYRTGDMVEVHDGECACGRRGKRIKVLGRHKNMLDLGGRLLHEIEIHEVIEQALSGSWQDWHGEITANATTHARLMLAVQADGSPGEEDADRIRRLLQRHGALGNTAEDLARVSIEFSAPLRQEFAAEGDVKAQRLVFA